jgi:hypothetical protein
MAEKEPGSDAIMYRSSAPVRLRKYSNAERERLLSLLHARVGDDIFDSEDAPEPFFFSVEASNARVDSYFTYMSEKSLRNYAADAADPGVQFQVSHNGGGGWASSGEVGFGRSLDGKFQKRGGDSPATVVDFYTIPGLTCGNMTSDQFILGARTGVYSDVSIGFTPGAFICNICDQDMLSRDWMDPDRCTHYPGLTYDVEKGGKVRKELCIARVEDAHLNEVSTVYDGATPGAGILAIDMGRMAAAHGRLNSLDHTLLENVYRVKIDLPTRIYGGTEMPPERSAVQVAERTAATETTTDEAATTERSDAAEAAVAVADPENPSLERGDADEKPQLLFLNDEVEAEVVEPERQTVQPMERLVQKYDGKIRFVSKDPVKNLEFLADTVIEMGSRIKGLEKDAADGRGYREELLKELDRAVVRAFTADGAAEKQARYRRIAEREDVAGVKELIADLELKAGERFQPGRLTKEKTENGDGEIETETVVRENRKPTPAHLV